MTENVEEASGSEPHGTEGPVIDEVLQVMVDVMDTADARNGSGSFAISGTLITRGGTVSGRLISHRAWAEKVKQEFADAGQKLSSVEMIIDRFPPSEDEPHNFVHMEDAAFVAGDSVGSRGTLMRIRLADVSGWSFAKISRA